MCLVNFSGSVNLSLRVLYKIYNSLSYRQVLHESIVLRIDESQKELMRNAKISIIIKNIRLKVWESCSLIEAKLYRIHIFCFIDTKSVQVMIENSVNVHPVSLKINQTSANLLCEQ